MRVLLVEDDRALSLDVQHALDRVGWRVDVLADGEQAARVGLRGEHTLAVLDLGLSCRSGMELGLTELLPQKAGRAVAEDSIVARRSSREADFSENAVAVCVHRLRKRFADLWVASRPLGVGCVLEAPVEG